MLSEHPGHEPLSKKIAAQTSKSINQMWLNSPDQNTMAHYVMIALAMYICMINHSSNNHMVQTRG